MKCLWRSFASLKKALIASVLLCALSHQALAWTMSMGPTMGVASSTSDPNGASYGAEVTVEPSAWEFPALGIAPIIALRQTYVHNEEKEFRNDSKIFVSNYYRLQTPAVGLRARWRDDSQQNADLVVTALLGWTSANLRSDEAVQDRSFSRFRYDDFGGIYTSIAVGLEHKLDRRLALRMQTQMDWTFLNQKNATGDFVQESKTSEASQVFNLDGDVSPENSSLEDRQTISTWALTMTLVYQL